MDRDLLRPSGTILTTQLRLAVEIESSVLAHLDHPSAVVDLLVRLDLAPEGRERASRLCSELNLSAAHMSRTIDRAEAAGLVVRRPDPDDRRAHLVVLTQTGEAVVEDLAPRLHALLRTVIHDVLSTGEIEELVSTLERVQLACEHHARRDAGAGNADKNRQEHEHA